jgi:magnesium transporter
MTRSPSGWTCSTLFLIAYAARLDPVTGVLATSELAAFITSRALITVRKDDGLDIGAVVRRWDESPDLAKFGAGYLLYGLLDYIVDSQFEAVQSLVLLRRIVVPMSEVAGELMRHDLHVVGDDLMPYYQDVYDQVLRTAEWIDSLRELATSILETNVTIQGNRLNIITKKVTGWAAIIAVPTLITGFFGMNVPYPGYGIHRHRHFSGRTWPSMRRLCSSDVSRWISRVSSVLVLSSSSCSLKS